MIEVIDTGPKVEVVDEKVIVTFLAGKPGPEGGPPGEPGPEGPPGPIVPLGELLDVTITDPQESDLLVYAEGEWVNVDAEALGFIRLPPGYTIGVY